MGSVRLCGACGAFPVVSWRHRFCERCSVRAKARRHVRGEVGRASSSARGYGVEHRRLRAVWVPRVAAGGVRCARCGRLIVSGDPWDLGHVDGDRSRYWGPEHRACNRATSSHRAKAARARVPVAVRADWW